MTSNVTVTTGNAVTNISVSTGGGNRFLTFATDSGNVVADSTTDVVTIIGAGGLTTSGDAGTDTVTINAGNITLAANTVTTVQLDTANIDISNFTDTGGLLQADDLSNNDTDDLAEGSTNLYYTDARFDTRLATKTTADLTEGTNLYYTDERVDDRVSSLLVAGEGIDLTYDDVGNSLTVAGEDATDTNKGIASFSSSHFAVASGAVSITANAITGLELQDTGDFTGNTFTATGQFEGDINGAVMLRARNVSGVTIYKGQAVFVNGLSGDTPTVILADASDPSKMPALGVARADINNNSTGEIVTLGNLYAVDTSASNQIETGITLAVGDVLYISATEPGNITNVAPTGESNRIQNIGRAVRVAPNTNMTFKIHGAGRSAATPALDQGNIFIGNASNQAVTTTLNTEIDNRVANTSINALSDVIISTATTGQVLKYNGANWVNGTDEDNLSNNTTTDLAEGTNLYYTTGRFDTAFSGKSTTDLSEGTNLYYTDARSRSAISLGTAGSQNYDNLTGILTIPGTTDHITEGTNLFYTQGRFDTAFSGKTTTDLTEGTNLYYTTGRFDTAFSGKTTTDLTEGTNLYYTDTRARAVSIENVVEDTTPQLGGSLDVNGNKIVSVANGNIDIEPNGTGDVLLGNFTFDADQTVGAGQDNYVLTYDNTSGKISLEASTGGLNNVVEDTTPQLGGDLDVNGNDIIATGTGSVKIGDGANRYVSVNLTADNLVMSNIGLDMTDENITTSTTNGDIKLRPNGTGGVRIGDTDTDVVLKTNGSGALTIQTSGGNKDITLTPNGTGTTYVRSMRVNSSNFFDMPQFRRQGTSQGDYTLEVSNDSTSTAITAGQPGGCFGFSHYSNGYTNPNYAGYDAYYVGSINAIIGDEGTFGSAGENNNAIRLYTYQDQFGFATNNVGEFRYASASLMKETLVFDNTSNVITIEAATANDDLTLKTSGSGDINVNPSGTGYIILNNLPTSSAGLPTGAVWNDSGTLKIA